MRSASVSKVLPPAECRFCLESTVTKENPLIEPCPCKGSVRFVHWACLKRWVRLDQANARACTICRQPFDASIFPGFVAADGGPRFAVLFVQHCYSASVALTYAAFLWHLNAGITADSVGAACWSITRTGALWTHAAYAACFWLCFRGVRCREAYWEAAPRVRLTGMLAAHAYALYGVALGAPSQPDYVTLALMQLLLKLYWEQHKATVERLNAGLLRDFVEGL
jgi:hypothetical protein